MSLSSYLSSFYSISIICLTTQLLCVRVHVRVRVCVSCVCGVRMYLCVRTCVRASRAVCVCVCGWIMQLAKGELDLLKIDQCHRLENVSGPRISHTPLSKPYSLSKATLSLASSSPFSKLCEHITSTVRGWTQTLIEQKSEFNNGLMHKLRRRSRSPLNDRNESFASSHSSSSGKILK